ncbi:MAG: precorrin-3B C(17)-methyltransferase [Deltaproteobacteria bacterium]|nr:precorrin-3B C(17)-methyltransferase [Deltaproteobacteria bacterium]
MSEKTPTNTNDRRPGKLFVVGIGPGGRLDRTIRAEESILASDVIVGYQRYLDLIADLCPGKDLISSGMTKEIERCRAAVDQARAGKTVSLVSSGDAGIYGMAGLALELLAGETPRIPVEIVPGVTSAAAAAARFGAPLMLDFACISLSDLLVPWEVIRSRLEAVAAADLVTAIYNPKSKKRSVQLEEAADIFRNHRPGSTPVGLGTAVGTAEEQIIITDLDSFLNHDINMRTVIIIGNNTSKIIDGFFVTPRGYQV